MKKIFLTLGFFLAMVVTTALLNNCKKEESLIKEDACTEQWQVYDQQIATILGTSHNRTVMTPEIKNLLDLREAAMKDIDQSKGGAKPLGGTQICWYCYCPNCQFVGYEHVCVWNAVDCAHDVPGCPRCRYWDLITILETCLGGDNCGIIGK